MTCIRVGLYQQQLKRYTVAPFLRLRFEFIFHDKTILRYFKDANP